MSDIENELTRVLHERALLIDVTPVYRVEPEPRSMLGRTDRSSGPRRRWAGLASVAALAAMGAALALGVWLGAGDRARPDPARPGVTRCSTAGAARLEAAIQAGSLPAGDVVLAGAADGDALIAVERGGVTSALDLVDAGGAISRLWTTGPRDHARVVANPSGALSDDSAVFVLVPTDARAAARTVVVDRATLQSAEIVPDAGYRVGTDSLSAPIVQNGTITLVETSDTHPAAQRIAWYEVDTPYGSVPTSNVATLLPVGGNVVIIRSSNTGLVSVDFDQSIYRPSTLEPAARSGYAFVSDGTTLRWLARSGSRYALWQWAPGDPFPLLSTLAMTDRPVTPVGRFVVTAQQLNDSTTSRVLDLPSGLSLLRLDGAIATVARHAGPDIRYARIPVTVLTNC